jgi:hypothetical protein
MTEQDRSEETPPPHGYARKHRKSEESDTASKRGSKLDTGTRIAAGVAFGIGSAALVAALLYAGRRKPKGKADSKGDKSE